MKSSTRSPLLILLVFSLLLLLPTPSPARAQTLQPHSPIIITSDSDFSNPANGVVSGDGSFQNPFLIDGWEITANTTVGIHIKNTQSYFTIKNAFIHPANFTLGSSGILLENVVNGRVEDVRISNFANGVWLVGSQNTVTTNRVWNNTYGIVAAGSSNTISDNQLYNNTRYGVWVSGSTASTFTGNNSSNNGNGVCDADGEGFVIVGSSNNVFEHNTATHNPCYGFRVVLGSSGNIFRYNNVSNNEFGLVLSESTRNLAVGNLVTDNNFGIGLEVMNNDNNVTMNRIINNGFGIYVTNSSRNTIYNNYLQNTDNAYDDSTQNAWNTTKTLMTNILGGPFQGGNFYSDYQGTDPDGDGIGDVPYTIHGRQGQQTYDLLPLWSTQPPLVHDVAVRSIAAQPATARTGSNINVTVGVFNQGTVSESFAVSVTWNQTMITHTPVNIVNLPAWSGKTFSLSWDTNGLSAGTYILRANASMVTGELNTANNVSPPTQVSLTTNQPPIAKFSVSSITIKAGTSVTLDASASFDPDGSIASYSWNFGDGTTGTGAMVVHSYISAGTYTLGLTVTDNDGARSNLTTKTLTVTSNLPSAPLNLQLGAANGSVSLTWSPPNNTGGSPITGYKIYRGTSSAQLALVATIGNQTGYTDATGSTGQTFFYQVSAVNGDGMEGPRSDMSDVLVPVSRTASNPGTFPIWIAAIAAAVVAIAILGVVVIRRRRTTNTAAS